MPSVDTDSVIVPTDLNNNPISDEGKAAYRAGALHQAKEFYERSGDFAFLISHAAVPLSNGKTAVESEEAAFFVCGTVSDVDTDTFDRALWV